MKYFKVFICLVYDCLLKAKSENYMLCLPLKLIRLELGYGSHCGVVLNFIMLEVLAKQLVAGKSQ